MNQTLGKYNPCITNLCIINLCTKRPLIVEEKLLAAALDLMTNMSCYMEDIARDGTNHLARFNRIPSANHISMLWLVHNLSQQMGFLRVFNLCVEDKTWE